MPWLVAGLAVAWLVSTLIPPAEKEFQSREFGRLPVLLNGRVQPLDSVARNALLQLRAKQSVRVTDKIRVVSVAQFMGEAIRRISHEASVSSLFD